MSDSTKISVALIGAVGSIVVALISGYFAIQAHNAQTTAETNLASTNQQVNTLKQSSAGSLADGQKLCRVIHNNPQGIWRDGLIVPENWNANLCHDYQIKTGGNSYQLGCIRFDGTTLATQDGALPSPNCGWN